MDGLEQADTELESFRKGQESWGKRSPNPMLLGLEPAQYVLWILRSIKNSELEQSLLVLSLSHIERLFFYLTNLLRDGQGVELCSRVGIFLIKTHQNQVSRIFSLWANIHASNEQKIVRFTCQNSRNATLATLC
jgi:U3 small nucleolar RNA-associated protein 12